MEINHLTDPIDVYSEWLDETERVNNQPDQQQYNQTTDNNIDKDDNTDTTQQRIQQRKKERSNKHSGYADDNGFIASEDDEADDLGIEED